jgi:hypothetical protein
MPITTRLPLKDSLIIAHFLICHCPPEQETCCGPEMLKKRRNRIEILPQAANGCFESMIS